MPSSTMPMFPLGTVLLPGSPLTLHVFEPRYRTLVRRCLDAGEPFGVVLIERGSEVGGGETRTDIGTTARLVEVQEMPDGRFAIVAFGERRLRVTRWLPDDPHPLAETEPWPDERPGDVDALGEHIAETSALLVECLTRHQEVGDRVMPAHAVAQVLAAGMGAGVDPEDALTGPSKVTFQLCALSPFGPLDRQQLLSADDPIARLELLTELLRDDLEVLTARRDLDV